MLDKIRSVAYLPMLAMALILGLGSFMLLVACEPETPTEEMGVPIGGSAAEVGDAMEMEATTD